MFCVIFIYYINKVIWENYWNVLVTMVYSGVSGNKTKQSSTKKEKAKEWIEQDAIFPHTECACFVHPLSLVVCVFVLCIYKAISGKVIGACLLRWWCRWKTKQTIRRKEAKEDAEQDVICPHIY